MRGLNPDVIIGVSLGGLILPKVATYYPKAKLIFVASSTSANPKSKLFKSLLNILATSKLLSVALQFPDPILSRLYTFFNPFYGDKRYRHLYEKDRKLNLKKIREISLDKHRKILKFIIGTDNSTILSALKQNTLILSSNNDPLTPTEEGEKLHRLIKNSRFVKVNGGHFEVIGKSEIREIERFLEN